MLFFDKVAGACAYQGVRNVKHATLQKLTLLHEYFSHFLKLYKWYQIVQSIPFKDTFKAYFQ